MKTTVKDLLIAFGCAKTDDELTAAEASQQIDLAGVDRLWLNADLQDDATRRRSFVLVHESDDLKMRLQP